MDHSIRSPSLPKTHMAAMPSALLHSSMAGRSHVTPCSAATRSSALCFTTQVEPWTSQISSLSTLYFSMKSRTALLGLPIGHRQTGLALFLLFEFAQHGPETKDGLGYVLALLLSEP